MQIFMLPSFSIISISIDQESECGAQTDLAIASICNKKDCGKRMLSQGETQEILIP